VQSSAIATSYDDIADEYQRSKEAPWRLHVEVPSFMGLVGPIGGRSVLDLACGEGFYTRRLKDAGASRVVGVDSSPAMVSLAQKSDAANREPIEYHCLDVQNLDLGEQFDLVTAAYLLNYAADEGQLTEFCQVVARHLRPGGRFVGINAHPEPPRGDYRRYGFDVIVPDELCNGSPITFRNFQDGSSFDVTVYHLDRAAHDRSFAAAGLEPPRWLDPQVSAEGAASADSGFWDTFLQHPPVALFEAQPASSARHLLP
jgi:toxoflavin synthase